MMPCSTPTPTTTAAVAAATQNSSLRSRKISLHVRDVDELHADQEDDGGEDRVREVLQRLREEEQHDRHDEGGRQLRDLGVALRLVDHLRLRRAAVHDEGAAEPGGEVGGAQADAGRRSRRIAPGT